MIGTPREGTVGHVCTVRDVITGHICVLKYAASGTEGAASLTREGELLGQLQHPSLVELVARFHWVGDRPVTGFATRWVDAEPIQHALEKSSLEERIHAFGRLCQVVDYLHRRRFLHLDLKPQNVLASEGRVWLLDLGTALPVDGAPGEAGGTLGYVAPEVLAGEAASVASDLFSLGAILYELLAGQLPYRADSAKLLRAAVLGGDYIPIRAVAPDIPKGVATVAERLMARRPADRPISVRQIAEELESWGVPASGWRAGSPPFFGRTRQLVDLREYLSSSAQPLAIVGDTGSGRTALALQSLSTSLENASILDLSKVPDPARCVLRLVAQDADQLADDLAEALRVSARRVPANPYWVFVGRREEMRERDRRVFDSVQEDLAKVGMRLLWAAHRCPPNTNAFPIPPLSVDAQAKLVEFVGDLRGADQEQILESTRGLPGPLLRALEGDQSDGALSAELRSALERLRVLPIGIPRAVLETLPDLVEPASQLVAAGHARLGPNGQLYVDGAGAGEISVEPDRSLSFLEAHDVPPLWRAVYAKRTGSEEGAARLLDAVIESVPAPTAEYVEICEWLGERGNVAALDELLKVRLAQNDYDSALDVLSLAECVGRINEIDQARRIYTISKARGNDHALLLCDQILARDPENASARVELGFCQANIPDFEAANASADRAEAHDPECAPQVLCLRVFIAAREFKAGAEPEGLEELLESLADDRVFESLASVALVHAGGMASKKSWLDLATKFQSRAANLADRSGDIRRAGIARLELGNIYQRRGEGRKAREAYLAALQAARALSFTPLQIRVTYSLAELELRSHRIPAAERMLHEFREAATRSTDPRLMGRRAVLEAMYHRLRGNAELALTTIDAASTDVMTIGVANLVALNRAEALLDLGRAADALEALRTGDELGRDEDCRIQVVKGRALLILAREQLAAAAASVPDLPDLLERRTTGAALLAAAGEDVDPASFPKRRQMLQRATELLSGEEASRAATLRERLSGPGARLTGVADLIEAIHDPPTFPAALARVVAEALGANRVLIMLRLPGLGRQVTFQELSGEEAAGISEEVLRRVQEPDDVWIAADAFADPNIRRVSATVRTFKIRSVLAVAIPYEGEAIGALYVDHVLRANAFSDDDVEVLKRLAVTAARIIPLMTPRRGDLPEPKEILGVLHTDADFVGQLTTTLERLETQPVTNVLVTGATGTGKTWFARRLATEVLGKSGIVEAVMRQSDPDRLVSMLGGTRRGDFTGAVAQQGLIKQALMENKALFLDEVQALDSEAQGALLPLLELPKRRFSGLIDAAGPLGRPLTILLGTNVDVTQGRWRAHFREDFWFRMSQVHMHLPTLSERGPEVIYQHLMRFLRGLGVEHPERALEPRAIGALDRWPWTGNLRELRSAAEKLAFYINKEQRPLTESDLARWGILQVDETAVPEGQRRLPSAEIAEKRAILAALEANAGNRSRTARALGMPRSSLLYRLKKYGIHA